jgi:hypothetical protein
LKILLHICCAPCAVYPLRVLEDEGSKVFGFFYNPNIHPYQEYRRRLETVEQLPAGGGVPRIQSLSLLLPPPAKRSRQTGQEEPYGWFYHHPAVQQEAGSRTGSPARRGSESKTWDPFYRSRFTSRLARRYTEIERIESLSAGILRLHL